MTDESQDKKGDLLEINQKAPAIGRCEGIVKAPREVVWEVLSTLEKWPQWNQAVSQIKVMGALETGTEFRWTAGGMKIRSKLLEVDPPHHIAWSGKASLGIHAIHTWTLSSVDEGTRIVTEESFDGVVTRLLRKRMNRELQAALDQVLAALKLEAERVSEQGQ